MKLAFKLVAVIVLEIAVLLAVDGYLAARRETRLFQADMQRDAHLLGNALRGYVAEAWRVDGGQRSLQLLEQANREQDALRVRWVWLGATSDARDRPLAPEEALVAVAGGQEVALRVTDQHGQRFFCTYIPVDVPTERTGAIEIAEPLAQLDSFASGTAMGNLILGLALISLGSASVGSLGLVLLGRPLHGLAEKAQQIGLGDLSPSLSPRGHDELAELARSINDMCCKLAESREQTKREQERRVAAIEQLRQADRLRTVGQLAAGVAHELGTPLNTISLRAGILTKHQVAAGEVAENARIIQSQCGRMTAIIRQLLAYARPPVPRRAVTDLRKMTRETINLLAPLAAKYKTSITLAESDANAIATIDADQIQQVLTNLLVNALQANAGDRQVIEVDVSRKELPTTDDPAVARQCIAVSVRDHGIGIKPENLKHIFDPFFTTKDVGQGTGLGLSIAYGIVQEHHGSIEVTSRCGEGSCFTLYLPVDEEIKTASTGQRPAVGTTAR